MKKRTSKNGSTKRIFVIAAVLIVLALLIVLLTARKNQPSITSSDRVDYEATEIEEMAFSDNMMGMDTAPMARTLGAEQKMAVSEPAEIAPDIMPEPIVDDNIPHPDVERRVIKNGNLSLRVTSLEDSTQKITTIATNYGGDVTAANFSVRGNDMHYGYLTVKVPVDDFTDAMRDIKEVASVVLNESLTTSDVTEKVVDLEARLTNKKAKESQLREFFDRAESIDDLLNIERNLSTVRGEIEQLEAQLKSLTNRTSFSTITVELTEDAHIVAPQDDWRPGQVAKDAVNALMKKFQNIVDTTIDLAIASLPVFLFSLVVLWVVYVIGKKIVFTTIQRIEKKK